MQKTAGVLICLALIAALIILARTLYVKALEPVDPADTTPVLFTVSDGELSSEVAENLKEAGLIRNAMVFESYAGRHSYGGAEIQAATYQLSPSMPVSEIFTKLVNGDSYSGPMGTVTIPEGKNLKEMAPIVEQAQICSADAFLAEAAKVAEYQQQYPILSSIPADKVPQRTLEGYLFPDTYNVSQEGDGASNLVHAMLTRFSEVYTPEMQQQTAEAGKTVDDIVILGSIVELETKLPEDRPYAASVFYNRMAQNMPLQSDITIDYINGTKTPVLTTEQTQVESPYNTYINLGLPFGPICSPGLSAMEAALHPAQTDYLYFVADMDSGKLYFNNTLEGHNADVAKYMGN